jgi:hypothetical protein
MRLARTQVQARIVLSLAAAVALAAGCKETARTADGGAGGEDGDEEVVVAKRSTKPELYATDTEYMNKNSQFFFRVWDETFTRRLSELPRAGGVDQDKIPMSGGYYPEQGGGTDVVMVGGRTPLQKYDAAFHGGQNLASAWEREKHTSGPAWAGHCNGYSAASQRHPKEPTRSVTVNGVTFAPEDIKALMAEIHMNADYEFLGGNRCDVEGSVPLPGQRADPTVMAECEDVNPGTFHAAIANWLGRMKHVLVMDQYSGDQVWNYPLYAYEVQSLESITEQQARQAVVGNGGEYVFNPGAAKFALVRTKLTFTMAQRNESIGKQYPGEMQLQYVLELDAAGDIVGGEWVGESQQRHPDFIWVALEPLTPNGTRFMGNQHLDNAQVIKLWAEGAGFDPANPPLDIKRPPASDTWGRFAGFDATLDGSTTGAVFAGKPAVLHLKRRDTLAGAGVTLEVSLNGGAATSVTGGDGDDLTVPLEPGLGLNRVQLTFKRGGTTLEDQFLRFHVVR